MNSIVASMVVFLVGYVRAAPPSSLRAITVNVSVTEAGQPLAGVPLLAKSGQAGVRGKTDEAGQAILVMNIPTTQQFVEVEMTPAPRSKGEAVEVFEARVAQERSLMRQHAFRRRYCVELTATADQYSLSVVSDPAISVSFDVQRDGLPWAERVTCIVADAPLLANALQQSGRIEMFGLRPNVTNTVFLVTNDWVVARQVIPASAIDIELPAVSIPRYTREGTVRITMQHQLTLNQEQDYAPLGITLVSSDGSIILSFPCDYTTGIAYRNLAYVELPGVPVGTYYVAPGVFFGSDAQVRLVNDAAAGHNLDAAGVPKVTVVAGQEAALVVDAVAVYHSIMGDAPNGG